MSKILDCESVNSTYNSLSDILGLSKKEIRDFLKEIDIEEYYNKNPDYSDRADKLLLDLVVEKYNVKVQIDKVCWFHLARTMEINNYSRGVYPLGEYINNLWNDLYSLVEDEIDREEWIKFKKNIEEEYNNHFADLYRMKIKDKLHWGPYAILVKEAAFSNKEIGNHDYLNIPEIVEDISICFEEIYGINLGERFINKSKSIIVKFISKDSKEYYVGIALHYLYNKIHNIKMSLDCNTCYDSESNIIVKESIISIEEVKYKYRE